MARYIDADKLIKELGDCTLDTWGKGLGASWWAQSVKLKDNMVECINKQPTADVVEVVRCKDCKHSHWNQETCHGKCVHYCDLTDLQIDKEHFCGCGEKSVNYKSSKTDG